MRDEIREEIEIANSSAITYYLAADKDSGTVTPAQIRGKKNETFEIMFEPSDNWQFEGWEVLNRSTGEPVTTALSFSDPTKLETKVTIKVPEENLTIHPKSLLLPAVFDIYPVYYPTGVNQDTVVRITFNKPVDPQSFGSFSCISFTSGATDVSDCYGTPYFSSDYTVLYIPTSVSKHILSDDDQRSSAEVTIKLNCANLKDADGLSIIQNQPYTYCVNKNVDDIAPVITGIEVTTTNDTNAWYYRSITDKPVNQWSATEVREADGTTVKYFYGDFSRNHVGKPLHVRLQGYDNADAVAGLLVREVYEKDISGNAASENELTRFITDFVQVTDAAGNAVVNSEGKKLYSFEFDYEFQNRADGLVLLEFILKDGANKGSSRQYEVVKQSETNKFIQFALDVDARGELPQLIDGKYKSHIFANTNSSSWYFNVSGNENMYLNYLSATKKFSLYFYDENDQPSEVFKIENFTANQSSHTAFNTALQNVYIDSYRDTKAKAVYYEETGVTKEYDFVIEHGPEGYGLNDNNRQAPAIETEKGTVTLLSQIYITYQANENAAVTKSWSNVSIDNLIGVASTSATADYPMGLYKIYIKRETQPLVCNGYISHIITAYGKPILYTKKATNWIQINLPFSIKNKTFKTSTGMADIELDVTYPDDGNIYYIYFENIANAIECYYSKGNEKTITVANGKQYYYRLLRKDPVLGFNGYTSQKGINLNSDDNFPPETNSYYKTYFNSAFFYIKGLLVTDKKAGLVDDSNHGITDFVCYYAKTSLGDNPSLEILEGQSIAKKTIMLEDDPDYTGKLCAKIPFSDVEQGEYYLYAYLKDKKGNGRAKLLATDYLGSIVHGIYFSLRNKTPLVVKKANKDLEVKCPEGESCRISRYRLEKNNNKWEWIDFDGGYYEYDSSYTISDYNESKDHFMMVTARRRDTSNGFGTYHLKPLFYYPNYVNGDVNCNSTSWIKVSNGWQIFCDTPAFCHTLYSARKITANASEAAALEWEAQAQETGIVCSESGSGFTYKDTNLADIPAGSWYTTICHFADGTVLMSDVQKK